MKLTRLLGTMALLTLPFIPSDNLPKNIPEHTIEQPIPTQTLEDIDFQPSNYVQGLIQERADVILKTYWEKPSVEGAEPILRESWEKSSIRRRLSRLSKIEDIIEESPYDENFIYAHLSVESEGIFDAVSSSKAAGVAQFKKGTAKESGVTITHYYDGRKNPEEAIGGYDNHITTILEKTDSEDSLEKVLTIYLNGLYSKQKRKTDSKTGEELFNSLSKTTRDYIIEVGAVKYLLDNNLIDYKRESLLSERVSPKKRKVDKGETIYSIGKKEGIHPKRILEVNPGLVPEKMPAGYLLSMPKVD